MNLCSPTMRGYAEVTREGHLTRDRCCQAVVHHPHRYTPSQQRVSIAPRLGACLVASRCARRPESAAASHVHVLGAGNTIKTVPPMLRLGCVNVSVSPAHDLAEGPSLSVTAAS